MTASPGRTPAADRAFTAAATSLRISCAILVPSRIRADMVPACLNLTPRGIRVRPKGQGPGKTIKLKQKISRPGPASLDPVPGDFHPPSLSAASRVPPSPVVQCPSHDCQRPPGNAGLSSLQAGARVPPEPGKPEMYAMPPGLRGEGRYPRHADR